LGQLLKILVENVGRVANNRGNVRHRQGPRGISVASQEKFFPKLGLKEPVGSSHPFLRETAPSTLGSVKHSGECAPSIWGKLCKPPQTK